MWSVEYLSLLGFPIVGDGRGTSRVNGGVEVRKMNSRIQIKGIVDVDMIYLFLLSYLQNKQKKII